MMPQREHGQAMIELAVFGSLMLLCLSYLVRYGQTYIYQQMIQQEAMRRAEAEGQHNAPLHSGSVVVLRDKRMIDPSNPFVTGPRQSFVASASLTMSNELLVNAPSAPFQVNPGDMFEAVPNHIPVHRVMLNGQAVTLRLADYRTVPGAIRAHICRYSDVYGQASVAVINPAQSPDLNDHSDDFLRYRCTSKFSVAKIKDDPSPPGSDSYTLQILDSCIGDMMDPKFCNQQCTDLCSLDLPRPAYCGAPSGTCNCSLSFLPATACTWSGIPDEKTVMGLDLEKGHRTRTINHNERIRFENLSAHQSSTTIDESERNLRTIRTSPISKGPSPYDTNGDKTVTVDQTVTTNRNESFSTPW